MPPSLPGFDHTRYNWVQIAPGKWTVEEKLPAPNPMVDYGPSLRDLMGGDLDLSMHGGVHFGPEDVSPRQEYPTYGGKPGNTCQTRRFLIFLPMRFTATRPGVAEAADR